MGKMGVRQDERPGLSESDSLIVSGCIQRPFSVLLIVSDNPFHLHPSAFIWPAIAKWFSCDPGM